MDKPVKHEFVSRPRDDERTTRKPLPWWDRVKFIVLLGALFWFMVWAETGDNPILPVSEAINTVARSRWWIFVLGGLEVVRQIHFVIAEHWSRYYLFWQRRFATLDRLVYKINPWTRYRLGRVTKWIVILSAFNALVAWRNDETFLRQLVDLPSTVIDFMFGGSQDMPLIFVVIFDLMIGVGGIVILFWYMSRGGSEVYFPDDVKTRFADVWGQDAVLEKIKENLIFLENPEAIEEKGGYVPAGILLYGPPGTGKTLMAEAVAGETGKPYVFVELGAFTNMFFGVGVLKVRALFKKLRKLALRYGGVIVFFDEADSLGNRGQLSGMPSATPAGVVNECCNGTAYLSSATRSALLYDAHTTVKAAGEPERDGVRKFIMPGMGRGGDPMALQALLAELSGLKKPRGFLNRAVRRLLGMRPKPPPKYRILVMMATNMPDSLDAALLRPGRIDRIYKVGYPSKEGRRRTFEGYFSKVKHELTDADLEKLATISPYATGATIKDIVNESLVVAIREGRDTVTWPDVLKAKHHKEHGIPDDFEYIERERHAVAIHEACHAVAFYRLDPSSTIDVATIERRGDVGGFVAPIPLDDQMFTWKSSREADIMISLASLAGERMFFDGDSSVGVGGDLRSATTVAMQMEAFSGMGSTVASHLVTKAVVAGAAGQTVETGTDRMWLETPFGERVELRLEELLQRVTRLLQRDRAMVLALAHALEAHRTVPGQDVAAIMEGTRGPTIDGAVYHDPAFQEQLEEYHRVALRAHKHTTRVAMQLPGTGANGEVIAGRLPPAGSDAPPPTFPNRPRRRALPPGRTDPRRNPAPVPAGSVPAVALRHAGDGGESNGHDGRVKGSKQAVKKNGSAKSASAKNGAAPKKAVKKNGSAKNGAARNGTSKNGSLRNGTAKAGAGKNGGAKKATAKKKQAARRA